MVVSQGTDADDRDMSTRKYWAESWPVVLCIICLISFPLFFDIYRKVAFNTAPRDDYAPFLLWFTSHQGHWPGSPFGYRVLSIIPAIPLFWLLPFYKFSLLPATDLAYLKATEALSALAFIATAGAASVAFKFVRNRLGRRNSEAALAAMLTIMLANFDGIEGVDPIGVLFVYVLLYFLERNAIFCPLFILAPFTNEKIVFFFLHLVAERTIFVRGFRQSHIPQIAAVAAGLTIYILAIKVIRLSGNEGQTDFAHRIPELLKESNSSVSSLKGLVRNIVPAMIFIAPCLLFALRKVKANEPITASDLLVPVGMLLVGLSLTEGFQVGRIVSYAMPLTVIASITLIGEADTRLYGYGIHARRRGDRATEIGESRESVRRTQQPSFSNEAAAAATKGLRASGGSNEQ